MNKQIIIGGLLIALAGGAISGCASTGDGPAAIQGLEEMTNLEYAKWQLYVTLGVKVGAGRLIAEEIVSAENLELAATAIELVADTPLTAGANSLIIPALEAAGLTNEEVQLLLLVAEQELIARGALDWLNPETGLIELSPRTKEMLLRVSQALRSAVAVSSDEQTFLQHEFGTHRLAKVAMSVGSDIE